MTSPEQALWCEVIIQAWADFQAPKPTHPELVTQWLKNRREAESFLTSRHGRWARSREDACLAAGIDPEALRNKAEHVHQSRTEARSGAVS